MAKHSFGSARRLKKPNEFSTVYQHNQTRVKGQYFIVLAFSYIKQFESTEDFENADTSDIILTLSDGRTEIFSGARVGAVVSKKVSKLAVQRNRIKRLIREQFRKQSHPDGFDFVVIAIPKAAKADNQQLTNELNYLWKKLHKRCDTV
ncbi:MAG: ribonuclease P protein component [Gammaproteobacteria bacterium]|nr:ribonuclease P protein component [Gammaproteobacteria bacterium]